MIWYNERISTNVISTKTRWLLADKSVFRKLCECNEHRDEATRNRGECLCIGDCLQAKIVIYLLGNNHEYAGR